VRVVRLRDIERGVRPEVCDGNSEALVDLVLSLGTVMLNVSVLGLDVVGVQIGNCGNVGMSDFAVVTLVIVVGQNLPVKVALHVPGMVKVVLLKVVVVKSGLLIDPVKVIFPGNLGSLAGVQVHPDKAVSVHVDVNGVEIVLVETGDVSLLILDDDELVAGSVILNPVTGVDEAVLVCCEKPFAREDRSSFQLVHVLRSIPGGRQCPDRLLLILGLDGGGGGGRGAKEIPQE